VDEARRFVAPALHVDGKVQYRAGECRLCHGNADSPAPPRDVAGEVATSAIGVGAHQAHLTGGVSGRPLECNECHRVPEQLDEPTHADGLPAEVVLSGVARNGERLPAWDRASATCSDSWCHAPSVGSRRPSPVWTEPSRLGCGSCHGTPPPAPHPQLADCAQCHADVVAADNQHIIDRARHVDGNVDVSFDQGCGSCHGSPQTPAPPRDVSGNTATRAAGVGAHAAHVLGTGGSRKVACETCHIVPESVLAAGHLDTELPAEVVFSADAAAPGTQASYVGGSCQQTSCHGAVLPSGHASGGSNTAPLWTSGGQATCGSCHGLPPPAPHPNPTYPCHDCHQDMNVDDVSFNHPELHVDGVVTFALP
jgi:predicted CxxxxCH...CXXCH cytochrome family protein